MPIRAGLMVGVLAMGAMGSGCAWQNQAIGLEQEQAVGVWQAKSGDHSAELTLSADGTFRSTNWPSNLFCGDLEAEDASHIDWTETTEVSGNWSVSASEELLNFDVVEGCEGEWWYAYVYEDLWGSLSAQFILDSITDPDLTLEKSVLWFAKQ